MSAGQQRAGSTSGSGSVTSLETGQSVGASRYLLLRPLGQGGMGVVWLAHDTRLDEDVALKFVPPEIRGDVTALDDLRRETLKSRRLSHPNIIRIHDLDESPGERPFISMEFVDGPSLAALKAEQPQRLFAWEFLKPLVQQLCDALDYAHCEKVIHRDLKPANMMLDGRGRLKLADFGLAATASESLSRLSQHLGSSGTPPYMSPQQMDGRVPRPTDDLYALGATLYELLTSKPPFYHGDIGHQARHLPADPPDQRLAELELNNEIPPDVAALIMACLAKEPEQRPQSAAAVAEWVGLATTKTAGTGSLEVSVTVPAQAAPERVAQPLLQPVEVEPEEEVAVPAPRRIVGLFGSIVAVVILVLVALGGWWVMRNVGSPKTPPPAGEPAASAWMPLDISAACNADVISTTSHKAADQITFNGGTLASASWLRQKGLPQAGLPDDGRVPIPDSAPPGRFQVRMPPGRNAILLAGPQGRFPQTATVELTAAQRRRYSALTILHTACWGNGTLRFQLHYETGADTSVSIPVFDWFPDGRAALPAETQLALTTHDTHPTGGKPADLFAQRIPVDPQRTLRSLTISFGSSTPHYRVPGPEGQKRFTAGVFAISGLAAGASAGTASTPTALPSAKAQPIQTVDLLALTDPVRDRVASVGGTSPSKANRWERREGALVYVSDGGSGKLAPPVAIGARAYEIEVAYERLSGKGRLHVDFPYEGLQIVPVYLDAPGFKMINAVAGSYWPSGRSSRGRALLRLDRSTNSARDHITVQVDDELVLDWTGDLRAVVHPKGETHPDFPGEPVTSLYAHKDSYKISVWQLRVFDGDATVMRGAASSSTAPGQPKPSSPAMGASVWIPLFDGRSLTGWKADRPKQWRVADGILQGVGPNAHLVTVTTYTNFEFKSEILTPAGGNGGLYFRVNGTTGRGFPNGYEAQVSNGESGRRTGSLYHIKDTDARLAADNTWFRQHVIAIGNRVVILVNDRVAVDFTDPEHRFSRGALGLQSHGAGKSVAYRNILVKPLPKDEPAAWAEVLKEVPDLK